MTDLRRLTGKQRYRQVLVKARIIDARHMRQYLAGEIGWCPATVRDELIVKEFDRMRDELARLVRQ